ncbi:MAG: DUF1294 domain-containing protein, partial [Planctomycetes bacterium]|nr:DUF1294 domain-containing protein [Planctomycetota bacterium]
VGYPHRGWTAARPASGLRAPSMAKRKRHSSPRLLFTLCGALAAAGLTGLATWRWGWHWVLAYLAAVNAVTFALYAHDKLAARRGWLRVPEAVLHLFALAGGTPLAYTAQILLRHKTRKGRFRLVFHLVAALQLAIAVWATYLHLR